jgi:hypothetical protein
MPFAVLAMDKLSTTVDINAVKKLDENGFINRNFNKPPIKDTLQIPSGGYAGNLKRKIDQQRTYLKYFYVRSDSISCK